ncbi:MAG: 2-C-methyl-D-erythritol 4-phosphate cytidylyltransferase [Planctomycetota bacterium]|nr:2-C-methyl-D-erythritol 4-phosphate cytidylyltransferase [Planctomycetota bacterium]
MIDGLCAIVPAAGMGKRLAAGVPKAFVQLAPGVSLLSLAVSSLAEQGIGHIVVAIPEKYLERTSLAPFGAQVTFVAGGERRQDSVRNAAQVLPKDYSTVFIHDAARPFLRGGIVRELHENAMRDGAAAPVLNCPDTLKRTSNGRIRQTVEREGLYRVQTPQVFRCDVFDSMLELYDKLHVTDDCKLAEEAGFAPVTVRGSEYTFKVTTPEDLELAKALYSIWKTEKNDR